MQARRCSHGRRVAAKILNKFSALFRYEQSPKDLLIHSLCAKKEALAHGCMKAVNGKENPH